MAKTKENVLVGVATLSVRRPNDAIAEWDAVNFHAGTHSVKLTKTGTGNAGGTSLIVRPPGITFASWATNIAIADKYTFYYLHQLGIRGNFTYIGYRFDDPDSDNGHVELSTVPFQNHDGLGIWTKYDEADAPALVGYYGENEVGDRMDDWSLAVGNTTATIKGIIDGLTIDGDADNWVLTKVFYTLFESSPARYACIDTIVINGVPYTVEPGGDAPAISLSSPFEEVGYTEDGVSMEYTADEADVNVEEETFPIDRKITGEGLTVTCNMAEATLTNMAHAMAGAALSGSILRLGDGVQKYVNLKIEGTNPAGYLRAVQVPKATATGAVGMSYRKGTKTIIPVTFGVLKGDSDAVTIVDNIA